MNLSKLSAQELVTLISSASAELQSRLSLPQDERPKDDLRHVALQEPGKDDKEFVLRLKTIVKNGGYASASDRNRIAGLVEAGFGPWIKRQGLPTERGTGPWRKIQELARFTPAPEK